MTTASDDIRLVVNPSLDRSAPYTAAERWILNLERHHTVRREIASWPGYAPTPLRGLSALAEQLGVGTIWYKDESPRFDLGTFKALGGAYGVLRVIQDEVARRTGQRDVTGHAVRRGDHADIAATITVTCATDGNHGRAVAWGAAAFGCRAVIYLPASASDAREDAIACFGAETRRVAGSYDDAVRTAQADARTHARFVVSDTSYDAYVNVPRDVMQAYTVLVAEALEQHSAGTPFTHVFVPGGVGGIAAAVVGHLWERLGADRPRLVVVEPSCAACLLTAAERGKPTPLHDVHHTIMDCLACGEVSPLAWYILERGADAFLAIPDRWIDPAQHAVRALDPPIDAGPSGAAALAGLLAGAEHDPDPLGLDADAHVLVLGTEGRPSA